MTTSEELEICARIKQARKEAGLTQAALAKKLHVEQRTVVNYEHNRVPWRLLKKIARFTGTTQEWLLHGEQQNSQLDRIERNQEELGEKLDAILNYLAIDASERGEGTGGSAPRSAKRSTKRAAA